VTLIVLGVHFIGKNHKKTLLKNFIVKQIHKKKQIFMSKRPKNVVKKFHCKTNVVINFIVNKFLKKIVKKF